MIWLELKDAEAVAKTDSIAAWRELTPADLQKPPSHPVAAVSASVLTRKDLRDAYYALARGCHPDLAAPIDRPAAEERMKRLNEGYRTLLDRLQQEATGEGNRAG